ncbi:response regulator transcription factor [Azonexus fungiphilus]|nr:response regulator transcription factor [Azonexus fungiphilus]
MSNGSITGYEVTYVDEFWQESSRLVLIVEDHHIVRGGLRKVISDVLAGVRVEFLEASTLAEARQIISERKGDLDLVLLDITLPDAGGADEVDCLKTDWMALPVVVVSACEDWSLAAEFLKAGALGFIPKSSDVSVMINALRLILAGDRYFPAHVFYQLTDDHAGGGDEGGSAQPKSSAEAADLSPRQKEVLRLILKGKSNKEIARELNVSIGTAKNYVAAVLRAYNASSRAKAISAALTGDAAGITPSTSG